MQVEVKNLTCIYQEGMPFETVALEGVSFVVKEGEFVSIIGHTGSGKTTLVQHIAGLLKPTSGEVIADRKKIGIVFQYPEYQLFEETVLKDVCFGPKNQGLSEEECLARAKEALRLVGLDPDEKGELSPFSLSGGEKRRVAIAGVLATKPEVLILDEPTAGLDPKGHDDILAMIEKVRKEENLSIILISHNMDDVANLANHVLVMDKGRLVLDGTPKKVFSQDEKLKQMGLGLPMGSEFVRLLESKGASFDEKVLRYDDLVRLLVKKYGN